ncbi:MAG: ergothioneine biosynthesis protein EgtB [Deltaproteobacteria bacterium]|nr:ergothioneine biosynthesis protein EgtB [Deltaproteobacteria bacterium]MBW2393338.1 ergothioneine biosynthesis protein EgtB [Deltaproteobacteria bacterium]
MPEHIQTAEADLAHRYLTIREATGALVAPLSPEDCTPQSMSDASPVKWHLAHTSWFFETFVLEPRGGDFRPFNPRFRVLFNSYYNAVGDQFFRPERGLVTRPGLAEVMAYREHVDAAMLRVLEAGALGAPGRAVVEVGLQHEQQHQELILSDVKHLLARNPGHPAYRDDLEVACEAPIERLSWHSVPGGIHQVGDAGPGFAFDNEGPRHDVLLREAKLGSRLVTNGEFLGFIEDGGYRRPEHWLSDGWAKVNERGWRAPLYWFDEDGERRIQTLGGPRALCSSEPVTHVSAYEADAYARWAGARLPTEHEWEVVAAPLPMKGNFVENARFHPAPASMGEPADGPRQLFGDTWEWTSSAYAPYPGYQAAAGALGEYNGKFMVNQLVLRGGSCATPNAHLRPTYRNFFYPDARWQFSGIRLARDE